MRGCEDSTRGAARGATGHTRKHTPAHQGTHAGVLIVGFLTAAKLAARVFEDARVLDVSRFRGQFRGQFQGQFRGQLRGRFSGMLRRHYFLQ